MNYENESRISSQNKLTDLLKPTMRTANPGASSANGLGWMSTYQVFRPFLKFTNLTVIRLSGRTHDPRHDLCIIIRSALSSQINA